MSDHLIQFLVLEGFVKELKPPKIDLFKRYLKFFNEREFKAEVIDKVDWNNIIYVNLIKKKLIFPVKKFMIP